MSNHETLKDQVQRYWATLGYIPDTALPKKAAEVAKATKVPANVIAEFPYAQVSSISHQVFDEVVDIYSDVFANGIEIERPTYESFIEIVASGYGDWEPIPKVRLEARRITDEKGHFWVRFKVNVRAGALVKKREVFQEQVESLLDKKAKTKPSKDLV